MEGTVIEPRYDDLTPWFPGYVNPERPGVYQRICPITGDIQFSYWNGGWACLCTTAEDADRNRHQRSGHQQLRWRGLKSNPRPKPDQSVETDAARYRWLMGDCDGDAQDDVIQWLAVNVVSKAGIDRRIDEAMKEG
jgi:hypothetical protein